MITRRNENIIVFGYVHGFLYKTKHIQPLVNLACNKTIAAWCNNCVIYDSICKKKLKHILEGIIKIKNIII